MKYSRELEGRCPGGGVDWYEVSSSQRATATSEQLAGFKEIEDEFRNHCYLFVYKTTKLPTVKDFADTKGR